MSSIELRNQIAKCRRLARFADAETSRRLLALADEYEARIMLREPIRQSSWFDKRGT